jgi:hypothetical protein
MRGVLLSLCVALCVTQASEAQRIKYLGDVSCGAWPKQLAYTNIEKAVPLNLVLGILFGRVSKTGFDVFEHVDIPSVSAWMDNYCQSNPLDSIIRGAHLLEDELISRASATKP